MDEECRLAAKEYHVKEVKGHIVAFVMLAISLFALYTHTLYLAIIPLLWMAFRAGKEQGREQAQKEMEQASKLARRINFPERERRRPTVVSKPAPLSRFPQH